MSEDEGEPKPDVAPSLEFALLNLEGGTDDGDALVYLKALTDYDREGVEIALEGYEPDPESHGIGKEVWAMRVILPAKEAARLHRFLGFALAEIDATGGHSLGSGEEAKAVRQKKSKA